MPVSSLCNLETLNEHRATLPPHRVSKHQEFVSPPNTVASHGESLSTVVRRALLQTTSCVNLPSRAECWRRSRNALRLVSSQFSNTYHSTVIPLMLIITKGCYFSTGFSCLHISVYHCTCSPCSCQNTCSVSCVFSSSFNTLQEFYTDDPKTFEDYGRIINKQHYKRIMALVEGSTVAVGGDSDESRCYIGVFQSVSISEGS